MEPELKQVMEAVSSAHWKLGIIDFAFKLGIEKVQFENGKPTDIWLQEKWDAFQSLSSAMNQFDAKTLNQILS